MEPKAIHVVLFKGIPDAAFYDGKELAAYLSKHGTTHSRCLRIWRIILCLIGRCMGLR